jgi:hypothetical protein
MRTAGFTVIIPLYNKRAYIVRTLETVLAQVLPAAEVIVVDDGSSDGGDALVEAIGVEAIGVEALGNPRVKLVRQANAGPGIARNTGIAQATGEWVALVDADDLWAPDHLQRLADVIRDCPNADLVATGFRAIDAGSGPPPLAGPAPARMVDFYAPGIAETLFTSSVAIRRSAFLETAGFAPFRTGEDTDFWIRFALDHHFAASDAVTVSYVRGNGGLMDQAHEGMRSLVAPPPSPVFETIAHLLADPRHAARHAALAAYGDRLRCQFARQLIYNGHPRAARALLGGVARRGGDWWQTWLATLVPRRAVVGLARLRNRLRHRKAP